jgi:putative glutamine amidotransferase
MNIGIAVSKSKTQYYINQAYADYVREAGFNPVLIVPETDLEVMAQMIDGLILPGGIDLDPTYYGEDNYMCYSVDPKKDMFERNLFHLVREQGKPIFGICRGLQLIIREYMLKDPKLENFMGFYTHIQYHNQVNDVQSDRTNFHHFVDFIPETLLGVDSRVVKAMPVNSMHHQCLVVDFKNPEVTGIRGFQLAAWTTRGLKPSKNNLKNELVCEGFRIKGWNAPILAVQWHPEELRDYDLISNFFHGNHEAPKVQAVEA